MENKGLYFGAGMINVVYLNNAMIKDKVISSIVSIILILYFFHKFFELEEDDFEGY